MRSLELTAATGGLREAIFLEDAGFLNQTCRFTIGSGVVSAQRIAVGGDWSIRVEFPQEHRTSETFVIGPVWAGNFSEDGHVLVTAMDDGTIRWYRTGDLEELLALFVTPDGEDWLAWSPQGVFAASERVSAGTIPIAKWYMNWPGRLGIARPVQDIVGMERGDVIKKIVSCKNYQAALGAAEDERLSVRLRRDLNWEIPENARLHILTIGINEAPGYKGLGPLRHAESDAARIESSLLETQTDVFSELNDRSLTGSDATKASILRALSEMRGHAATGAMDTAVIYFAGHSELCDGDLRLVCADFSQRNTRRPSCYNYQRHRLRTPSQRPLGGRAHTLGA